MTPLQIAQQVASVVYSGCSHLCLMRLHCCSAERDRELFPKMEQLCRLAARAVSGSNADRLSSAAIDALRQTERIAIQTRDLAASRSAPWLPVIDKAFSAIIEPVCSLATGRPVLQRRRPTFRLFDGAAALAMTHMFRECVDAERLAVSCLILPVFGASTPIKSFDQNRQALIGTLAELSTKPLRSSAGWARPWYSEWFQDACERLSAAAGPENSAQN